MAMTNPDQTLVRRFLADRRAPIAVDSNPMAIALGMTLCEADADRGRVVLQFAPTSVFIQGAGMIQGGALAAMLDFAMAFAVLATLPEGASCVTLSLTTSFLRAATQGRYGAVGEIERRGRSIAFASARLFSEDRPETSVATAVSTLSVAN